MFKDICVSLLAYLFLCFRTKVTSFAMEKIADVYAADNFMQMGHGDKEGNCVSGVRLEPPQFQWALFKGSDLSAIWRLCRKSLLASALDTLFFISVLSEGCPVENTESWPKCGLAGTLIHCWGWGKGQMVQPLCKPVW